MYRLVTELLQPYPLFLLLAWLALANLWRKRRETRRRLLLLLLPLLGLTLISTPAVAYLVVGTLEWQYPPLTEIPEDVEAIVVLGGSVSPPEADAPAELTPDSIYRCLHAARLYRRRPCPVLASGGKVDPLQPGPAVAEAMADFLRRQGVEGEIMVEDVSRSTHENAVESHKRLEARGIRKVVLVTEAIHMPRSERCFRKQGVEAVPSACAYTTSRNQIDLYSFMPSPNAAFDCARVVHEWLGIAWYRLHGRI